MDLILVFLITAIVIWKSIYTFYLIRKFSKVKNRRHKWINIILFTTYILYFYFLFKAANDSISSPVEGPIWLILIFIILVFCNILYDFKNNKFED